MMTNLMDGKIENDIAEVLATQAETVLAQAVAFDDLSDQELESRITKEYGSSAPSYC